jgi:hypothetical protein
LAALNQGAGLQICQSMSDLCRLLTDDPRGENADSSRGIEGLDANGSRSLRKGIATNERSASFRARDLGRRSDSKAKRSGWNGGARQLRTNRGH